MDAPTQSTKTTATTGVRSGTARATAAVKKTGVKKAAAKTTAEQTAENKPTARMAGARKVAPKKVAEKNVTAKNAPAKKVVAAKVADVPSADTTTTNGAALDEETRERTMGPVRAYETPIFAAMFSRWDGPAASLIGSNLHRADDDTMVFDNLMWRPNPDGEGPALRFYVSGERHAPIVTVTGELKPASVALVTTPLRHILRRRPRQMIVDLAGITAVSPAALGALLDVRQAARAVHVDFWLRSPSEPVRQLLKPAANAQVEVRSKRSAERRPANPISKRGKDGDAIVDVTEPESAEAEAEAAQTSQAASVKTRPIAAKFSAMHRRGSIVDSQVLEGVVVQGPTTRARPWWSSHSLRESLRRVGTHQHAQEHGSTM